MSPRVQDFLQQVPQWVNSTTWHTLRENMSEQLVFLQDWSQHTMAVIDEVIPETARSTHTMINGEIIPYDFSYLFNQATHHTHMALMYWSKLVYPFFLNCAKLIVLAIMGICELLKYAFTEKVWPLYQAMTPQQKIIFFGIIIASIAIILLARWVVAAIVKWTGRVTTAVRTRWNAMMQSLKEKSQFLAKLVPHFFLLAFAVLFYFIDVDIRFWVSFNETPLPITIKNKIVHAKPVGQYTLFVLAFLYPVLSTLYTAIVTTNLTAIFMQTHDAQSKQGQTQDPTKNTKTATMGMPHAVLDYLVYEYPREFQWLFASRPKLPTWTPLKVHRFNAVYLMQFISHFGAQNSPLFSTWVQGLEKHVNYYVALAFLCIVYWLPLVGHAFQGALQYYHYGPLLLTFWLLNPLANGADLLTKVLSHGLHMLSYIPFVNIFFNSVKPTTFPSPPTTTTTTTTTTSPSGDLTMEQKSAQVTTMIDRITGFLPQSFRTLLQEGGLLLAISLVGCVTPNFVTNYLSLIPLFLRPIVAAINITTRLNMTLQQVEEQKKLNDHVAMKKTSQEAYGLMQKLSRLALIFIANIAIKLALHNVPILSSIWLIPQAALAVSVLMQTPMLSKLLDVVVTFFSPIVRHVFLGLQFNQINRNSDATLKLLEKQKDPHWSPLFYEQKQQQQEQQTDQTQTTTPKQQQQQSYLHFTKDYIQTGITPALLTAQRTMVSPIVTLTSLCCGKSDRQTYRLGEDEDEESDYDVPQSPQLDSPEVSMQSPSVKNQIMQQQSQQQQQQQQQQSPIPITPTKALKPTEKQTVEKEQEQQQQQQQSIAPTTTTTSIPNATCDLEQKATTNQNSQQQQDDASQKSGEPTTVTQ